MEVFLVDILEEEFFEFNRFNLVNNYYVFSTTWLNKSRRYYSMIRSSGRDPSVDALARLAANLKQRHEICKETWGNRKLHSLHQLNTAPSF